MTHPIKLLHELYRRRARVQLRLIKHLTTDLRAPRDTHRLKRNLECRKP